MASSASQSSHVSDKRPIFAEASQPKCSLQFRGPLSPNGTRKAAHSGGKSVSDAYYIPNFSNLQPHLIGKKTAAMNNRESGNPFSAKEKSAATTATQSWSGEHPLGVEGENVEKCIGNQRSWRFCSVTVRGSSRVAAGLLAVPGSAIPKAWGSPYLKKCSKVLLQHFT